MLNIVVLALMACESLTALQLPHTTITSSATVAAEAVPAHCEVKGVIRPTKDSEVRFEVWLPATGWNGKYLQVGNGGWAGNIPSRNMADPLNRGYAVAGTDDGHQGGGDAAWAIGHPEKLIDFGYRAVHETSVQAKAVVRAFYGRDPTLSYFVGCSDGGREALMEAQRYPDEFNGIIAGAPANNWSHLFSGFVWNEQAALSSAEAGIPPAKLPAIQNAALAACDGLDGLKDGLLEDPRVCRFDPSVLLCKAGDNSECLTASQIATLKKIYAGPKNPRTGEQIFPGYPPGAEAAPGTWAAWITPANPANAIQFNFGNTYYGQAVFEDPKWDFRKLDFDSDVRFGDTKAGSVLNSNNPDLRSFRAEGGKLLQYHGWGDAAISALSSIEYYDSVRTFLSRFPDERNTTARPITDFYRLFMAPGMGHCGGGAGANTFDTLTPLEAWVEKGIAPEQIIATGSNMSRPLCVYPNVARYKGSGNPNDASSFQCVAP
jgi:hypothetical protein